MEQAKRKRLDPSATGPSLARRNGSSSSGDATSRASTLGFSSTGNTSRSNPNLRRANTVNPGVSKTTRTHTHGDRKNLTSSLLRAKNSSEVSRQRSIKRPVVPKVSELPSPTAREGKHFTVGNVGHNGRIYLRPMMQSTPRRTTTTSLLPPPSAGVSRRQVPPSARGVLDARHSIWSTSQFSELRPTRIHGERSDGVETGNLDTVGNDNHHQRSQSFSTIAEHEQSSISKSRGEFRIVIDRAEDHTDPSQHDPIPSLEVPIPHYRLGTPQFNLDGQPILRSSVYTRTSVSDHPRSSYVIPGETELAPLPQDFHHPPPQRRHIRNYSAAMSLFSNMGPIGDRSSTSTRKSAFYTLTGPIEPSLFDALSENMEAPSVIRYIPGTTEISAATPARIIAQISSDSFMDYELVSDFFLSFRPYLSTSDLLSLLMARLQWAINRLQDDGRIIRIRTFAALRHWILNYFVDDFVVDRHLRVQFCEQINSMYDNVKQVRGESRSDLKILVDLKRCWHGRCALYWDCPDLVDYDTEIIPGGVAGSRDVNMSRLSQIGVSNVPVVVDAVSPAEAEQDQPDRFDLAQPESLVRTPSHGRSLSSGTVLSASMSASDQSFQPVSCSLPPNPLKRTSLPSDDPNAPHPVPVETNPLSESTLCRSPQCAKARHPHPVHKHKRSGSFSDSIRDDRAPLPQVSTDDKRSFMVQSTTTSSLIRGNLIPPGNAIVELARSPSPTMLLSTRELQALNSRSSSEGNIRNPNMSPGVRTLIGSIRRALHSKPGVSSPPDHVVNGDPASSTKGQTVALPVNVAFGSATYRERKAHSLPKVQRIDLLCDQVSKDYRDALGMSRDKEWPPDGSDIAAFHLDDFRPSQDPEVPFHLTIRRGGQRLPSQVTMGSQSIVIVDDTGLDIPVMSGGLTWMTDPSTTALQSEQVMGRLRDADAKRPSNAQNELISPRHTLASSLDGVSLAHSIRSQAKSQSSRIQYSGLGGRRSSLSLSRLRKYASFSSAMTRPSMEGTAEWQASESTTERASRPFGRMLRRKPGGDLRKVRNLHDLPTHPRTHSAVSDSSLADSLAPSTFASVPVLANARAVSTPTKFSLIKTHSSQQLRPSLEAVVAEFSQIPDDDDGGIESTLLKLEGKWQKPSSEEGSTNEDDNGSREGDDVHVLPDSQDTSASEFQQQKGQRVAVSELYSGSLLDSECSYSSIPLLERGLSDESMKTPYTDPYPPTNKSRATAESNDNREPGRPSTSYARSSQTHSKDAEDNVSDLSSELSVDLAGTGASENLSYSKEVHLEGLSPTGLALDLPPHPLAHPPSPPMTASQPARPATPPSFRLEPLTPGPSPTHRKVIGSPVTADAPRNAQKDDPPPPIRPSLQPNHVPFILGFDSQTLARQLTLVEKAALDEVDWKDLVEMKWNNTSSSASSWVQFLSERECKGIDLVVGRFNLVVKWILSEIVLTRDTTERSLVLTKYIHIATHARRMYNYATMLQIAIALSSVDCTRLRKTWALVSSEDKRLFKDMENLIQPIRNFHDLRMEMETANLQDGCIPFVGLYVHDLTYNAQKPAQISNNPNGEPLVNFERYRTTAKIVKCLLRLIDASNKYTFEPIPAVLGRCLWIASLPEDKIQFLSKHLE